MTHEHFDADGNLTGRTVVTAESPWTDDYRALVIAEAQEVCPRCGNLRSICSDPTRDFHEQHDYCYATAAVNRFDHAMRERYSKLDPATGKEWREDEGLHIWASERDLRSAD